MRYREVDTDQLPSSGVHDGMLIGTVIYALLVGIGMVVIGRRARQHWIAFWGLTLILASLAYLLVTLSGWG